MKIRVHQIPGLVLTDHEFVVPLNYQNPKGPEITIFAREVVAPTKVDADLPWLLFLQGGPGFGAPRPTAASGWLKRAIQEYRVLLLDQRGTGLSTPATHQTLAHFASPQAQADYLRHFRADAIVKDAELIRQQLVGQNKPWTVLGQSYGGFCITHYLSAAPEGLQAALFTGGLPPILQPIDAVYRATYQRVIDQNQLYYERYPNDVPLAQQIVTVLAENDIRLPSGNRLMPRRFQQLGLAFGASDGFEQVHYLLEEAFATGLNNLELSYPFLRHFEAAFAFQTNPIFALLHEPIYCEQYAPNWSASRIQAEFPVFEIRPDKPTYFTGEMIYPWMFSDYGCLTPLREVAHILATDDRWPVLYNLAQLQANTVPCAAAVYYNDMYVERRFSEETAQQIKGIKLWITNEYEHNGLRADGESILDRLLQMVRGKR